MKIRVSIIGANGYTGLELLKILANHSHTEVKHIVSRSNAGSRVCDLFASLKFYKNAFFEDVDLEKIAKDSDVCFLCLPHATSAEIGGKLFAMGVKIIDLSADFRYDDIDVYESVYKVKHPYRELCGQSVYGLCEINEANIRTAGIIGNPGCYTTCSILPLYPLLSEKLISTKNIIIDAKSGTSGAGRKADVAFSFCEVNENFKAYAVTTHRHMSEIEEKLSVAAGEKINLAFTPHLLPVQRGILATIYADINATSKQIQSAYEKFYANKPFVTICEEGVLPQLKDVTGTNNIDIGYKIDTRLNKIIIISVLDNLIKGASGQAVQNMNLMFGLDQREGITSK